MPNLSEIDQIRADREIARFLRGEIRLLDIPSWLLIGKRCEHTNVYGRCINAVMTDKPYCWYHERFARGFGDIQPEGGRR